MERRAGEPPSTATDAAAKVAAWMTSETVTGLRLWGTSIEHRFPMAFERLQVGSHPTCDIQIDDATVSAQHAVIERRGPHVVIEDRNSKNGTYCEGQRQPIFQLLAGGIVGFGATRLVAFSDRLQVVRAGLQRYLGYSDDALGTVEATQLAATRRQHLALMSERGGDTLALARYIHAVSAGSAWPYVDLTARGVRVPDTIQGQKDLLSSTAHGTLVVSVDALPKERTYLVRELALGTFHVTLIVTASPKCDLERALGHDLRPKLTAIAVPSIDDRRPELPRIISETVAYHLSNCGASGMLLRDDDYAQLQGREWRRNHDELDETVRRLVLVRKLGGNQAARVLGMSPSAVSQWASKYGFKLRE